MYSDKINASDHVIFDRKRVHNVGTCVWRERGGGCYLFLEIQSVQISLVSELRVNIEIRCMIIFRHKSHLYVSGELE